jgi:RNA polymerase sigma-70 factor (ECF subfamily)
METTHSAVEQIFRHESGRVLAALISHLCDFELAEDVFQDALVVALERWSRDGVPQNPGAWITTVARRKAIDRLRRRKTHDKKQGYLGALTGQPPADPGDLEMNEIPDERLKLIFTCCHPALALEAQVALTLRTLGGLETAEIAKAFLVPIPTMAQRLVRAKRKIKNAGIPYRVPSTRQLPERLEAVLAVLYLIFNESYDATAGDALIRRDLCREAIRLASTLNELLAADPGLDEEPEALGLLALMLLHDARRAARTSPKGDLVLLEEQDRTLWDRAQIAEGLALLDKALSMRRSGPYQIQAAIAALHAEAESPSETDWPQIALLYRELYARQPTPVVGLNRAVAVAMAEGPMRGLALLDELGESGALEDYYLFHAARADLLRRAGWFEEAAESYAVALELAQNKVEKAYLGGRLEEMEGKAGDA